MKKTPIAALTALAALSLGLVATGCGGDGSTEGSADMAAGRTAAAGSPGPATCGQPTTADTPDGGPELTNRGVIYISCVDQPVTVWAADVDPFDWQQGGPQDDSGRPDLINGPGRTGPGTEIRPGGFVVSGGGACRTTAKSWGWQMGVTLEDGSRGSARVQLPGCPGDPSFVQARFRNANGPTTVEVTTDTGQRVTLVAKKNTDIPGLKMASGRTERYLPILIEPA